MTQDTGKNKRTGAAARPAADEPQHKDAPARVGGLRLALALGAGKLLGSIERRLKVGGGTSLPGKVARMIDPDVLRKVMSASTAKKIAITGSNGKTTTSQMLGTMGLANGLRVSQNRAGANMLQGVTTVAVDAANLHGEVDADLLIFEIDEGTFPLAIPEIEPDVVIVTNIFRDQLDRYGEMYNVASALERVIRELPASSTVLLNGDDPLVANFAPDMQARRLYFGLEAKGLGSAVPEHAADTVRCVHCQQYFVYETVYMSHLGAYRCPNCGYARPTLDVALTATEMKTQGPTTATIRTPEGEVTLTMSLVGLHNLYNATAAIGVAYGLGLSLPKAALGLEKLKPAFGRLEPIQAGDRTVYLSFVKNPTSYNTILRTVQGWPGGKHVLVAASNTVVDGEDFAWFWDVELEQVASDLLSVTCSGNKAEELAMRFKYAGVPEDRVERIHERVAALDAGLRKAGPGGTLFIFAGYTPTLELRRAMTDHGWVPHVWQE